VSTRAGAGATSAAGPRVAVLDYGMGNLRSVEKALVRGGAQPSVTRDQDSIRAADGVVLPGVGAFPKAMHNLRELGLASLLEELVAEGVPTLGICLGMQLLFESSSENEGSEGLGFLKGSVTRLPAPGLKVPLIGWSQVTWARASRLTEGLPDRCPFYFVHSFAPIDVEEGDLLGTVEYGERFVCAVEHGTIFGVQFHPEKSSASGLRLLENFTAVCTSVAAPS
jgi:glutamine amidotransferase